MVGQRQDGSRPGGDAPVWVERREAHSRTGWSDETDVARESGRVEKGSFVVRGRKSMEVENGWGGRRGRAVDGVGEGERRSG